MIKTKEKEKKEVKHIVTFHKIRVVTYHKINYKKSNIRPA